MSIRWSGLAKSQKNVLKYFKENPESLVTVEQAYGIMGTKWGPNWKDYTCMRMREMENRGLVKKDTHGWRAGDQRPSDRGKDYYATKNNLFS